MSAQNPVPAMTVENDGTRKWTLNGKLHRENGPAVEWSDGGKTWYRNGQCHREDGPADEYPNGGKYWYQNGRLHREDGPAIEESDGGKSWYRDGVKFRPNMIPPIQPSPQIPSVGVSSSPSPKDALAPEGTPNEHICVICSVNLRNTILIKCRHSVTCVECTDKLKSRKDTCPVCRSEITDAISYFKP
jgi:hypothetical protein